MICKVGTSWNVAVKSPIAARMFGEKGKKLKLVSTYGKMDVRNYTRKAM